jgi:uncharacterized protein (DUF2062 family)
VGFGIFMGIFPVWGFQMLIAIAVSFFFRLNKMLVLLAANISIPPMIPIIIYLSHLCGALWMGKHGQRITFDQELTIDSVMNNLVQYIVGAITLAVAAGLVGGAITYIVLKTFRRPSAER